MTTVSPETSKLRVKRVKNNPFIVTLKIGFSLNDEERKRAAEAMRNATVYHRMEVVVPRRHLTRITKEMSPEEKQAARDEADASNAARLEDVRVFFAGFLPADIALLLAQKMKSNVEGFVVRITPNDENFTMIVDHS